MSKKKISTCCLVIDASIARAASPLESRHPTGVRCRDFLIAVRSVSHRMAWSEAIKAEWDKHQSTFATQWLVTMRNLRKLQLVQDEALDELREAIEDHSDAPNVVAIMVKDAHLIEAALATGRRIAAQDKAARGHFTRLAATLDLIRLVNWVDPAIEDEQVIAWVERGAPLERFRRLKP
jgi:hypothetical protein